MSENYLKRIQDAISNMSQMPHLKAISGIPELFSVEVNNSYAKKEDPSFIATVFNMECGTRPEKIMPYLQLHPDLCNADIILANELDYGMARSNNKHVTRDIAEALGMNYAYGIEFITAKAGQGGNTLGWHGNAILSKYPLHNAKLVHLPIMYDWFYRENDCRLGTRVAILAEIEAAGRRIGLVCVHLENRATPEERERQLRYLLECADEHFGNIPILVGGDMNTNTVNGDTLGSMNVFYHNEEEQDRRLAIIPTLEPLMRCAEEFGYSYTDCNLMNKTTRRKPMPDGSTVRLNLDWFFQKGLTCSNPLRVETVFKHTELSGQPKELSIYDGQELSDHDAVVVTCRL